jgi:hypothetical protein
VNGTGEASPGTDRISLSNPANGALFPDGPRWGYVAPVPPYSHRSNSPFGDNGIRPTAFIAFESPAEADLYPQGLTEGEGPLTGGPDPEGGTQAPTGGEGPIVIAVAGWLW